MLIFIWILYRLSNRNTFKKVEGFASFTNNTFPLIGDIHFAFGLSPNSKNVIKFGIDIYFTVIQYLHRNRKSYTI